MRYFDKTFINLISINSLNLQVHPFPSFAESIRKSITHTGKRKMKILKRLKIYAEIKGHLMHVD